MTDRTMADRIEAVTHACMVRQALREGLSPGDAEIYAHQKPLPQDIKDAEAILAAADRAALSNAEGVVRAALYLLQTADDLENGVWVGRRADRMRAVAATIQAMASRVAALEAALRQLLDDMHDQTGFADELEGVQMAHALLQPDTGERT